MSSDRPDSLLTSSHRAFLSGKTEYEKTDPAGRTLRTRLRKRLAAGLQDFPHLAEDSGLDTDDVELLRELLVEDEVLEEALVEMVAFLYRLEPLAVDAIIEDGIQCGVDRYHPDFEVGEVSIPIHRQGELLRQARAKMDEDQPLTEREIRVLLTDSDIDAEAVQEHVRKHPTPASDTYPRRYR